jgi:hypothetical protein
MGLFTVRIQKECGKLLIISSVDKARRHQCAL